MQSTISKPTRKTFTFTAILCICIASFLSAAEVRPTEGEIAEFFRQLQTPNVRQREAALKELIDIRTKIIQQIVNTINASTEMDLAFHGHLHLIIEAAAIYRAEEAVVPLLSKIKIRLNKSSIPVGYLLADSAYYPAVGALIRIGGRDLVPRLLEGIRNSPDEETSRLCGWVLQEYLGQKLALHLLREQLNEARHEAAKNNFRTLVMKIETQGSLAPLKP